MHSHSHTSSVFLQLFNYCINYCFWKKKYLSLLLLPYYVLYSSKKLTYLWNNVSNDSKLDTLNFVGVMKGISRSTLLFLWVDCKWIVNIQLIKICWGQPHLDMGRKSPSAMLPDKINSVWFPKKKLTVLR